MSDPLADLSAAGVSIWLDDLSRERLRSGSLAALIRDKHVVGVTSNPTIFQKAIEQGSAYDDQTRDLALRGVDVGEAVRALTTADVRAACDLFRPVYDATNRVDGRVSIEVDPRLAKDTDRTIAEARALWWLVDRENVFIKIPATVEGLPAITRCIAEGIKINVTLIFSLERYAGVMDAYISALQERLEAGLPVDVVDSVASFFVSRVDTEVDHRLDVLIKESTDRDTIAAAQRLRGQAAIANARLAYEAYEQVFSGARWTALEVAGATKQRPLWASTGVKDTAYDDTRYVVELVAPGTVNTMPEATLYAVADHGALKGATAMQGYQDARTVIDDLESIGVGYDDVVGLIEREGVTKFEDSWRQLNDGVTRELERIGADVSGPTPAASGQSAAGA